MILMIECHQNFENLNRRCLIIKNKINIDSLNRDLMNLVENI